MQDIMSEEAIVGLVSAAISAVVSWIVAKLTIERNDKSALDNELSEILKIGIEHPYLEQTRFTTSWKPELGENDDRYATYDLYATLVFNHLEKVCKFHRFRYDKIQEDIDMQSWVKTHETYWKNPIQAHENILGYDLRFLELIDKKILKKGKAG